MSRATIRARSLLAARPYGRVGSSLTRTAVLVGCLMASGCVLVARNHPVVETEINEPPHQTVVTARIGESLLKQGRSIELDSIYVPQDVRVSLAYTVRSGTYTKDGETSQGAFYSPSRHGDPGEIMRAPLSDPVRVVHVPARRDRICVIDIWSIRHCKKGTLWNETTQLAASDRAFQQHLIYNGMVGDTIRVGYREFSPSLARPAFSNEVEYDLAHSNVIAYKDARLEVLDATETSLTYRVLSGF